MEVIRGHQLAPPGMTTAVAIGNFDGVHVGHQALIRRARELAGPLLARAVALTFDPHPAAVVGTGSPPPRLSSLERRVELLDAAGLDAVVVEPFTRELAAKPAADFMDHIVIGALGARAIVVGYNFNYGAGRGGTIETLRAHGDRRGVAVSVVAPVDNAGEVASSTKIRGYLRAGDLEAARRLLGREWDIDGTVVHGAKRGRAIGIPTANIATTTELVVAPGIYAVRLSVERGPALAAVASLGTNPTFVDQGGLVLEVHVLDWDGDLYDRHVRTTFVRRLRDELKFSSVDALVEQIRRDVDDARRVL
ncbi:MAG: bifunctional riboflavin kinase/FAD synthetase [Kofleriaceae bacterium]